MNEPLGRLVGLFVRGAVADGRRVGIETDGRLTFLGAAGGIPKTASGLVVR